MTQLDLFPDQPMVSTKQQAPVVVEVATSDWTTKMCIHILVLVAAAAGSNGLRRPDFLPFGGLLYGAAKLVTQAYSFGLSYHLGMTDTDIHHGSSLADTHRIIMGGE